MFVVKQRASRPRHRDLCELFEHLTPIAKLLQQAFEGVPTRSIGGRDFREQIVFYRVISEVDAQRCFFRVWRVPSLAFQIDSLGSVLGNRGYQSRIASGWRRLFDIHRQFMLQHLVEHFHRGYCLVRYASVPRLVAHENRVKIK